MRRYKKNISVIVPVYNNKQYICGCVKSVLKQTCTDFELILIDDGSDDGSKEKCEKLRRKDERIICMYQKHRGVSAARNAGIDIAKGKYLFFLDSDDIIHPQLLEALYNLQEKNHTVIATVGLYSAGEGKFQKPRSWKTEKKYMKKSVYLSNENAITPLYFTHSKIRLDAIGGKLILRDAVKSVRFDEKLTRGEDTQFLYRLVSQGADVTVLLKKWYYYRKKEKSRSCIAYSKEICAGKYKMQREICDCAIKRGRIADAVFSEWCLMCEMVLWYEMGRKNQDGELIDYMKKLIKAERRLEIFSEVDWCRKQLFYLGCKFYPFYKLIENIMHWYHVITGNQRELLTFPDF